MYIYICIYTHIYKKYFYYLFTYRTQLNSIFSGAP